MRQHVKVKVVRFLEQADRALVATIRMMRGGSEYVQAVARTEVEKYHAMCGREASDAS